MKKLLALLLITTTAFADGPWHLPQELSPQNLEVTFIVDTTWHDVDGIVHQMSGRAWLTDPKNPRSVQVEALMPVASFDTDNSSRDEEMRSVMDEPQFKNVYVKLAPRPSLPDPSTMTAGAALPFVAEGDITIRDVTRRILLDSRAVLNSDGSYTIEGDGSVNWADFGVKDASILIAKVHPTVRIHYRLSLREVES